MFTTHTHHRTATTVLSGLFALTVIALVPAQASAALMPADPDTFVPTPTAVSQLVTDGHASNVRAAIQDLWSDQAGK
jgi:hypothetical protein